MCIQGLCRAKGRPGFEHMLCSKPDLPKLKLLHITNPNPNPASVVNLLPFICSYVPVGRCILGVPSWSVCGVALSEPMLAEPMPPVVLYLPMYPESGLGACIVVPAYWPGYLEVLGFSSIVLVVDGADIA